MKRIKGIPETVPIKEVYAAYRAGFYAGCEFSAKGRGEDHFYLASKRAIFLKQRFNSQTGKIEKL